MDELSTAQRLSGEQPGVSMPNFKRFLDHDRARGDCKWFPPYRNRSSRISRLASHVADDVQDLRLDCSQGAFYHMANPHESVCERPTIFTDRYLVQQNRIRVFIL